VPDVFIKVTRRWRGLPGKPENPELLAALGDHQLGHGGHSELAEWRAAEVTARLARQRAAA